MRQRPSFLVIGCIVAILLLSAAGIFVLQRRREFPRPIVVSADNFAQIALDYRWCNGYSDAEVATIARKMPGIFAKGTRPLSYRFRSDGSYSWSYSADAVSCRTHGKGIWKWNGDTRALTLTEEIYGNFSEPCDVAERTTSDIPLQADGSLRVKPGMNDETVIRACDLLPFSAASEKRIIAQAPAGWKTFISNEAKFAFSYPPEFAITVNRTHEDSPGSWLRLELAAPGLPQRPSLAMHIDPDGFGPFFPEKMYAWEEGPGGTMQILEKQTIEYRAEENYADDGRTLIIVANTRVKNGRFYYMQFSFLDGEQDHEPLLDKILATVRFAR